MAEESLDMAQGELEMDRLILLVVGSHLRAETADRPIAYRLRQGIVEMVERQIAALGPEGGESTAEPFNVVVCTDVWWLNNEGLRDCPTISIGGPGVNALSAYLGDKLPGAFVVDDQMLVQMDVELTSEWVCIWGIDHPRTIAAVQIFAERFLERYVRTVVGRRLAV